jgi:hypothetical protein
MTSAASSPDVVQALCELAEQVRHGTLQLLQRSKPAWLTWSPPGTSNHILWHAGHTAWLQDALTVRPLTGGSELRIGWAEMFGQNSSPASTKHWPNAAEVRAQLENQLGRILELLEEHADAIVARADDVSPTGGWPLLAGMIHGWHDEARHQGEMYLLYKICHVDHTGGKLWPARSAGLVDSAGWNSQRLPHVTD